MINLMILKLIRYQMILSMIMYIVNVIMIENKVIISRLKGWNSDFRVDGCGFREVFYLGGDRGLY